MSYNSVDCVIVYVICHTTYVIPRAAEKSPTACVYVSMCLYVYMYICLYMYICMCVYTQICMSYVIPRAAEKSPTACVFLPILAYSLPLLECVLKGSAPAPRAL
jgi:hypothetical protein